MKYFVYLIECSDSTYYCGYTTDLERRVDEHNSTRKGAKYTYNRKPVVLKYYEEFHNVGLALKREHQIKKLKRIDKVELLSSGSGHKL